MKNIFFNLLLCLGLLTVSLKAESQILKGIGKKIEKGAEKAIGKALEGKSTNADAEVANEVPDSGPFRNVSAMSYDFVPGNQVVFIDDFEEEASGKMASRWTSNGMGTATDVAGFSGKWLKLFDENTYKIKELVRIPENFTLEFDLLVLADSKGKIAVDFGFDHQKGVGRHYFLPDRNPINVEANFRFDRFSFTSNELAQRKNSEIDAHMSYFVNDVMKVAIKVVGNQMTTYINEYKVLDTEMINPMTKKYFYIAVDNDKNQAEIYLDNVRISKL